MAGRRDGIAGKDWGQYLVWLGVLFHILLYIYGTAGNFCGFQLSGISFISGVCLLSLLIDHYAGKRLASRRGLVAVLLFGLNIVLGLANLIIIC